MAVVGEVRAGVARPVVDRPSASSWGAWSCCRDPPAPVRSSPLPRAPTPSAGRR